jgi:hypothetical protein
MRVQMPTEGRKFAAVDGLWRRTMAQVHTYPRVMDCVENAAIAQARVVLTVLHSIG